MNPATLRIIFGVFLIAHGLMTMSLATVPVAAPGALHTPFFPAWWRTNVDSTWPVARLGLSDAFVRTTGWVLWLTIMILFVAAGAGLLGIPCLDSLWQPLAAIGAGFSLLLLGFYWHPWLILGVLINIFILLGVFAGWFIRWFPAHL